jgi:dCTP deaminase
MILPDHAIHRRVGGTSPSSLKLVIDPFEPKHVQPATIDLTLDRRFKIMVNRGIPIDPYNLMAESLYEEVRVPNGGFFALEPGMFVLGSTVERFEFPADLAGRLEGKSSLARLGLVVHSTAGFFDPGFKGTCTLEFSSSAPSPILLWPGMKIAHMSFHLMDGSARKVYGEPGLGSKYMDQEGAVESRYDQNERVVL